MSNVKEKRLVSIPARSADNNVSRIAIFQALNLGDLLCATPALRAIRRHFPAAEIALIGRPWAREMVTRLPALDRVIPFPGYPGIAESPDSDGQTQTIWPPFDLAIQMHGSGVESNGFVASLGAVRSLGYGPAGDDRLTIVSEWLDEEPEPVRWLRLISALGIRADGLQLDFSLTREEEKQAARLIGPPDGRPVIGLHAGASDPARRWPPEAFSALADALAARFDARIILTGVAAERPMTAQVQTGMRSPAIDLAGRTTLGQFGAVIAALDLLVTNDTGASHIAAATGTPSVVLFGPTDPRRWAPLDLIRHHVIRAADHEPAVDGAAALRLLPPDLVATRCHAVLRETRVTRDMAPSREYVA
jgi:ADP-heptose:LPS heptosyltransferase